MLLSQKLKIFGILTFAGVVLVTVSFVSPGWVDVKVWKPSYDYFLNIELWMEEIHLPAGLWYVSLCFQRSLPRGVTLGPYDDPNLYMKPPQKDRCEVMMYTNNHVAQVVDRSVYLHKHLFLEIRILSSVGIFCAVLGFIGTIVFTRSVAKSRYTGLLTCITLPIAGGTYLAALIKTATTTNDSRETISTYFPNDIEFQCPWGLILGGIGSVLVLVSAFGHLYILSMYKTNDDARNPYTTIAPPGYNSTDELKIPLADSLGTKKEAVNFSQ